MGTGSGIGARSGSRTTGARRRATVCAVACALLAIAFLGASGVARAVPVGGSPVWIGSFLDHNWSTPSNWSTAPVAGNDLTFPAVATNYTSTDDLGAGTLFRSITLASSGYAFSGNSIKLSGGISATYASGDQTFPLGLELTAAQSFNVTGASGTLECTGALTGAGALTKGGAGNLRLYHDNKDYTGTVVVNGGALDINDGKALGTGSVTVTTGSLRFQATLPVANAITLNGTGLLGAGALQNTAGGRSICSGTLTLGSDATIGVSSGTLELQSIADSAYVLTKTGSSPMVISGTPLYTGAINVAGGTLEVDGTLQATCDISVLSGGVLCGTGTTGPVTVSDGGAVGPGGLDPGTITTAGLAMGSSGAALGVHINGTTAGSGYGQVVSNGPVSLNGTLGATIGYTPAIGDAYTIIDKTSPGAVSGTFSGLAEGGFLTAGGKTFKISYVGGDGNDVVLTRAQKPTTFSISAGNDQSAPLNTAFTTRFKVRLLDENGDPMSGASVTFTAPGSGAGGTFAGSSTVTTDADGYATAPAFTANTTLGAYDVTASTAHVDDVTFSLTNAPGLPSTLAVEAGDDQSTGVGTAFATRLKVLVEDAWDNAVPDARVTFTAPGSGAGGTFAGSSTVTSDADGFAEAPVFTANGTAGSYTVTASCTGVATPASFDLTNEQGSQAPPVTTVHGVPSGWSGHSVRLTFTAKPGAGGSPVAYTEYRVGSGDWVRGDSVTVRRQGVTKVAYRSVSAAGDFEARRVCTVRVDSVKPVVRDFGRPTCSLGGAARFAFRVADGGASRVRAKLVITCYGQHVRTIDLGRQATGERLVATVRCGLPAGTWDWRIVVHDRAGARGAGHTRVLTVTPR